MEKGSGLAISIPHIPPVPKACAFPQNLEGFWHMDGLEKRLGESSDLIPTFFYFGIA